MQLGASPGAVLASSPGLMQYRESQGGSASVRPGKRKGQSSDSFFINHDSHLVQLNKTTATILTSDLEVARRR